MEEESDDPGRAQARSSKEPASATPRDADPAAAQEVGSARTRERNAQDELAALARGLRAHAARRSRYVRKTAAPTADAPLAAATSDANAKPAPARREKPSAAAESERGIVTPRARAAPPASRPAASLAASANGPKIAAASGEHAGASGERAGASAAAHAHPARSAADVREQARACADLESLRHAVAACRACSLCTTRTQTVFQDGRGSAGVLFIGEAPGAEEDRTGVPFVGRAGQLLTDIITKGMGLAREDVVIANVLKCRPPENRDPSPAEKATCTPWLDRQVELVDPRVIIPLGRHAAMHVLQETAAMGAMRQQVHVRGGRKIVPTFHPAYLLRNPADKKECWKDIQLALEVLGKPVPRAESSRV